MEDRKWKKVTVMECLRYSRKSVCFVLWGWPQSQRREGKHDKRWPALLAKLLSASSSSLSSLMLLIGKWFIMCNCVPVSNNIAPRAMSFACLCALSTSAAATRKAKGQVHAVWSCKPVNLILTSNQFNNADACVFIFLFIFFFYGCEHVRIIAINLDYQIIIIQKVLIHNESWSLACI